MIDRPKIVHTEAQEVAAVHIETPRSKIRDVMGSGIREAMAAANAQGIGPAGPWFAHHLRMTPEAFDFDICVPVTAPVAPVGRVKGWVRPAVTLVSTVYRGPYEGLGEAWHEFTRWIEANGHATEDDLYECYLVGPETSPDPATSRTELSGPVRGQVRF